MQQIPNHPGNCGTKHNEAILMMGFCKHAQLVWNILTRTAEVKQVTVGQKQHNTYFHEVYGYDKGLMQSIMKKH